MTKSPKLAPDDGKLAHSKRTRVRVSAGRSLLPAMSCQVTASRSSGGQSTLNKSTSIQPAPSDSARSMAAAKRSMGELSGTHLKDKLNRPGMGGGSGIAELGHVHGLDRTARVFTTSL